MEAGEDSRKTYIVQKMANTFRKPHKKPPAETYIYWKWNFSLSLLLFISKTTYSLAVSEHGVNKIPNIFFKMFFLFLISIIYRLQSITLILLGQVSEPEI